jgi:hypothetical protein
VRCRRLVVEQRGVADLDRPVGADREAPGGAVDQAPADRLALDVAGEQAPDGRAAHGGSPRRRLRDGEGDAVYA